MAKKKWWEYEGEEEIVDDAQPETGRKYRSLWDVPDDENIDDFDGFGGYGYAGKPGAEAKGYDAKDTIDDSADYWYGRNSFRYGRAVDYSPSRLFRSTFTTRYSSYGSNEAQNKAIRALRVLTRNANTIASNNANGSYAVQFSAGASSNEAAEKLNDDKQRVVYVSPDSLLATKTTEDEDNVVDALTGFVLLRVQMAQAIAKEVIQQINAIDSRGIGLKIGHALIGGGSRGVSLEEIPDEELDAVAAAAADYYLAGTLAKSILMRLARRGVIENWGGFVAYFVRHAKKFVEMREVLIAAEPSLETLINQIAFNMLDDEQQIELPPFAVDVITKWLGVEVAPEKLLEVCEKIVADLRAHLVAAGAPVAAIGDAEDVIRDMLKNTKAVCAENKHGAPSDFEKYLQQLGSALFDSIAARNDSVHKLNDLERDISAARTELTNTKSLEQLLRRLEEHLKNCESIAADPTVGPTMGLRLTAAPTVRSIEHDMNARPKALRVLNDAGKTAEVENFKNELKKIEAETITPELVARLQKLMADFKAMAKKAGAETTAATEKRLHAHLTAAAEELTKTQARLLTAITTIDATSAELDRTAACAPACLHDTATKSALKIGKESSEEAANTIIPTALKEIATLIERLNRSRTAGGVDKIAQEAATAIYLARTNASLGGVLRDFASWYSRDRILRSMVSSLEEASATTPAAKEETINDAVKTATMRKNAESKEIAALTVNEFFKQPADKPRGLRDYDGTDLEKLKEVYPEYATTAETVFKELCRGHASEMEQASSESAGKECREKLEKRHEIFAPVDDELFGKKIAAKTKVLDGKSISRANDEARSDPEEEYVAYITGGSTNETKPIVRTEKEFGGRARERASTVLKTICTQYRSFISRVRDALQFQAGKRTEEHFGLLSGDLDEGGLHKLNYDCEHIWTRKTTSRLPDVAVGILVDQSGSMSGMKIDQARTICIILAEALRKISGVRLYVYGHTANRAGNDLTIYEHYTPAMGNDITKLGSIAAHTNNYDGYAIKDVAKRLAADPAKRKYLFVIADGLPAGSGYGGNEAQKHVKSVCKFVRTRLKIGLYAFAVGISDYQKKHFKDQYDEKHIVFVDNVMKCLPQIVRFLRNALQKEKKLVSGVE